MGFKENRNWLVLFVFSISIFLILYMINVFLTFGLIFWEIAFLLIISNSILIIWAIRRIIGVKNNQIQKYKHRLVIFSLIALIIFNIFAVIPHFMVGPLGTQYEALFKQNLGANYWNEIPAAYRARLKPPGLYLYSGDLLNFVNPSVSVNANIPYETDNVYQIMDIYEDKTIIGNDKPALIFIHGGGSLSTEISNKRSFYNIFTCNYFASLGFICFSIEYTSAVTVKFPQGPKDVRYAIAHIKSNASVYNINASQITVMGASRGGHLATLCTYTAIDNDTWWQVNGGNFTDSDLEVACVVDIYGAVDPFISESSSWLMQRQNGIFFGSHSSANPYLFSNHTVKNFVSVDCPPTLIVQGTLDTVVTAAESRGLYSALVSVGASTIYLEVPFGQHGFDMIPGTAGNLLVYYFVPRYILSVIF